MVPPAIKIKINLLKIVFNILYDMVSVSCPESCLKITSHTPTICPSFKSSICSYRPLAHYNEPCHFLAVPWTCQWLSTQRIIFFILSAWNSRESQGLFPSRLSAFYSNVFSLKLLLTSLGKIASYASQLQQTPFPPLPCFSPLHSSPTVILCIF